MRKQAGIPLRTHYSYLIVSRTDDLGRNYTMTYKFHQLCTPDGTATMYNQNISISINPTESTPGKGYYPNASEMKTISVPYKY